MQVYETGNPKLDVWLTLPYVSGFCIVAVLAVLTFITRKRTNVPGPYQWPIIGNTIAVLRNRERFLDYLVELQQQYGNNFTLKMPFMDRFVAVAHPDSVEYMLKTNFPNYVKGYHFHDKFHELLGYGIFAVDGELWRAQRKTASHMFSVNSFRDHMTKVFNRNGDHVVKILDRAAQTGEVLDLQDVFFRFTLDSVGEISFGSNIDSLGNAGHPFSRAFDNAQSVVELRFWEPWWKIKRALNLSGERHLKKSAKTMMDFAYNIVRRRRKESVEGLEQRGDLLSKFMLIRDKEGKPLSDDFLRDVIMNFMIAGRDTTANVMSWASYMLIEHPEVRQRLREEAAGLDKEPTYDAIKAMRYTRAVIQETLRLYPSVPKDGAQCMKNDVFPDGTRIEKGNLAMFMPYVMGRMPELWGEDCREFKPDRFFNQPEPSPFKFPAFKAGPRICLGKNMAYFEAGSLLSKIFTSFDLKLEEGFVPHYLSTVTLPMRDGLRVRVTRRS